MADRLLLESNVIAGLAELKEAAIAYWGRGSQEHDLFRHAIDSLKKVPAANIWQPIETAPKDGTVIIGAYFNQPIGMGNKNGDFIKCWFQPEFDAFISSCRQMIMAEGYTIDGAGSKLHSPDIENVTHWMSLPAPPESNRDE